MENLLFDGLKLMIVGMGFVYVFLIIMIYCMKLLQKVLEPFSGLLEKPVPAAPAKSSDDDKIVAVAAAAVELFRKK